jgi:hypothetical protein
MAKTYWEKLQDPRWQKKRLEVMEFADFHCEICGDAESTLNVHHKQYFKGREPWEYDPNELVCLCKGCHETAHGYMENFKYALTKLDMDGPYSISEIFDVFCGLIGMKYEEYLELVDGEDCDYLKRFFEIGKKARFEMYGGKYE